MKKIAHRFFKCTTCAKKHFKKHKTTYFGFFWTFAIVGTVWLLAKLFIAINIDKTFATEVVVNKDNIVSEYGCIFDASACDLSNRGITSIAPDTFINHTNLQKLHLNKNKLTSINLSGITSLLELRLEQNQLITVNLSGFLNLNNLQIRQNQLTDIDLSELTNLKWLGMGWNQFTGIDLSTLTNLNWLSINYSPLTEINLSGLDNLTRLRLDHNELTSVPESLMNNQYLQTGQLNLYYNRISTEWMSPELVSFIDNRHTEYDGDRKTKQRLPFTSCSAMIDISESECEALVDLYNSTNGDGWTNKNGWFAGNSACNYHRYGVKCDENNHVRNIELENNNLSWTVNLGNLPWLKKVGFGFNPNLYLDLSTLAWLPGLQRIYVYNVKAYWDIAVFSSMEGLETLQLIWWPFNHIYGNIDAFSGHTKLQRLWIINTDVEGTLDSIPYLQPESHNQTSLVIYWNRLTWAIPVDFASKMQYAMNNDILKNNISNNFIDVEQDYDEELVEFLDSRFTWWRDQRIISDIEITSNVSSISEVANTYVWFPIVYTNNWPKNVSGAKIFVQTTGVDITWYDSAGYVGKQYGIVWDSCYEEFMSDSSSGVYYSAFDQLFSDLGEAHGVPGLDFYFFATNLSELFDTPPQANYQWNRNETEWQWFLGICNTFLSIDNLAECVPVFGGFIGQEISLPSMWGNMCWTEWVFRRFYNLPLLQNGMTWSLTISWALIDNYSTWEILVSIYAPKVEDNDENNNTLTLSLLKKYIPETPNNSNLPSGWRWYSFTKDVCENWDCSPSYYDWICGICPLTPIPNDMHQAPNTPGDITGSPYSNELNAAYLRAYNQWITTMPTIQKANIGGHLIRSHMAKMMVEFASLFEREINTWDECSFSDMDNQSDEMKYYATLACQLRIMWLDGNENPAEEFNPDGIVTRAEFGTAFSRLIFGGKVKNWKWKERYVPHLQALKDVNIMKKIDEPFMEELRWRVMLMMMRSAK